MLITFEQFSRLVDDALVIMRDMIQNNEQIKNYVNKE